MDNKSKTILVIFGIVIVVILLVIAIFPSKKETNPSNNINGENTPTAVTETNNQPENTATTSSAAVLKDARVEAPNANPITTDNKVVTAEGEPTLNNVSQTSSQAPAETGPIKLEQVSTGAVKLEISAAGYNPKEFTVKSGAPVTVAVTSVDAYAHSFVFDDTSLSAIGVGVYGGETRAITFNAPDKPGEYTFFCNVGSHRTRGESGKMIVK
jgi:plastocyanin